MRITKQKLMRLIKEELASDVSLDEVSPRAMQAMAQTVEPVSPQKLAKDLIEALKVGTPGEDAWLQAIIAAFSAAARSGTADTNSAVKRYTQLLITALQDMVKDPEPEPEEKPTPSSGPYRGSLNRDTKVTGMGDSRARGKRYNEGKVTKNALEDLIKEAVAELINK